MNQSGKPYNRFIQFSEIEIGVRLPKVTLFLGTLKESRKADPERAVQIISQQNFKGTATPNQLNAAVL